MSARHSDRFEHRELAPLLSLRDALVGDNVQVTRCMLIPSDLVACRASYSHQDIALGLGSRCWTCYETLRQPHYPGNSIIRTAGSSSTCPAAREHG